MFFFFFFFFKKYHVHPEIANNINHGTGRRSTVKDKIQTDHGNGRRSEWMREKKVQIVAGVNGDKHLLQFTLY